MVKYIPHKWLLIALIAFSQVSCKKKMHNDPPNPSPPQVFLKDFSMANLPSPYYHFEYNPKGEISFVSVESGFKRYEVLYVNGKLADMRNNIVINKDTLRYFYQLNGLPAFVEYINETGVFRKCEFFYSGEHLIKAAWKLKVGNTYEPDRTMDLTYFNDGNVHNISEIRHAISGRPELTINQEFSQYDNKINVDGFSLLYDHDNSDHLLLFNHLPIQKNNPGKVLYTGALHYQVLYTYDYNEKNCPVRRQGQLTMLSGPRKGEQFSSNATYSYYP
ncbi:MAG: hypothetical protein J7578_00300 [Chitinophagaceae bacterium]|nr:hypothetical protein [Chitinophagaceae bacterium]